MKRLLAIFLVLVMVSPVFGAETVSKKITKGTAITMPYDGRTIEEGAFEEAVRQSQELKYIKEEQAVKDKAKDALFEAEKKYINSINDAKMSGLTFERDTWKTVAEKEMIKNEKWYNSKSLWFGLGAILGAGAVIGIAYSMEHAYDGR